MEIELKDLKVGELVEGYHDDGEGGVVGYGGKLDIRPPYQREFVYKDKEREAVIDSVMKGFPLNAMYWSVRGNGTYEIIDGQQRTISIAQYVEGKFATGKRFFENLQDDEREHILDYQLMVYLCSGTDSERLDWFRTINIAGKELSGQELRNAVYAGSWVTDAKKYFSRPGGAISKLGKKYLSGSLIRQKYLETVIKWISGGEIEDYMGRHQNDKSAAPLWEYFQAVIDWVESAFTEYRKKFMPGVDWGYLYNDHKDKILDPAQIEKEVKRLIFDSDVTNKKGIYEYILTGNERCLNIRVFDDGMKQKVYEGQDGICKICEGSFEIDKMEADHITPWSEGGETVEENCQMLCKKCNREKSSK